ncbi:MBL fold metallo-hydrolase, partial [Paradesulfitobacterium aromaticivorans]
GATDSNTSNSSNTSAAQSTPLSGNLKVHFIDVGQADSILIQSPSGTAVLVDAGNNADGTEVVNYLKAQGVKELAAVVATHPHEDHIGGMDTVIKSFPVKQVYMPNATSNTKTFEDMIAAINASGAKRIQTKAGVVLDVPGISEVFLAPNSSSYSDTNNYSAVLKITYGSTSFLLTGDAAFDSENEMLRSGNSLKATLLKVGHHGSNTSTGDSFLKAVSPKYAVISVGAGNKYGHPAQATLDKLASAGVTVYRTDQAGTIVATSDGSTITIDKNASPIKPQAPPSPSPSPTPAPTPAPSAPVSSSGSVSIASVDLSAEVVTISNSSGSAVDLTGWKLVSVEGNQTYNFPAGTSIPAGGTLKVVSGNKAQAGPGILVWTKSYIWNNDGDPAALYNAQGEVVSRK